MQSPNILLFFVDQHRADCIGVNGHPFVQTPTLDRLAAEGVNFTHAFCPSPICTPSRVSLLTGRWATQHGQITNAGVEVTLPRIDPAITFTQALRQQGYFLGNVGKWGVSAKQPPSEFGFHTTSPEHEYDLWRRNQGLADQPNCNGWFGECDPHISPGQSRLFWGASKTIELLEQAAAASQPFFIRWDPSEPHLPNVVPEPYASLYPPQQILPWVSFPDPLLNKPLIQRQQRISWGIDEWTWAEWAPVVGRYLGEVTLLDQQVGRVLATLEALGLAENTLVAYAADHGDLGGGHGMIDKHYVMYEELVRVPLILRWPGRFAGGRTCDAFVSSSIDLASTFCDAAAVTPPAGFAGASLLPLAMGAEQGKRQDIFATYHGSQFGLYSQRMVRDRRWKYVWNPTAEDELYDLHGDPGELSNLSGSPEYTGEIQRLRSRLVAWMEATGDGLLNQWTRRQLLDGCKGAKL